MRKELLKGLTDEQIKKVEACKSSEEILALAKEEGVALNDEQLEAVSGGGCSDDNPLVFLPGQIIFFAIYCSYDLLDYTKYWENVAYHI